jgi:hypothetical protein
LRLLAASSALLRDLEEARSVMARLHTLDPGARVSTIRQRDPLRRPENLTKLAEGLRLAGLPE